MGSLRIIPWPRRSTEEPKPATAFSPRPRTVMMPRPMRGKSTKMKAVRRKIGSARSDEPTSSPGPTTRRERRMRATSMGTPARPARASAR